MTTKAWRTPEQLEQAQNLHHRYWPAQSASGRWAVAHLYQSGARDDSSVELVDVDLRSEDYAADEARDWAASEARGFGAPERCDVPDLERINPKLAAQLERLLATG